MEPPSRQRRDLEVGAVLSVVVHLTLIALLVVFFPTVDDEEKPREESMEVVLEDEQPVPDAAEDPQQEEAPESEAEQPPEDQQEEPEPKQQEEQEDQPDDEDPPDPELMERYAVEQITDGEEPEEADHISDEAHTTEEETVAETTTLEDVEPTDDPEAKEQEAETDREIAMETPEELIEQPDLVDPTELEEAEQPEETEPDMAEDEPMDEEPPPQEEPVDEQEFAEEQPEEPSEWRDPDEMFVEQPDADEEVPEAQQEFDQEAAFARDFERAKEMFDEQEVADGDDARAQGGRQLLANWQENEEAMRASLENFVPHVQPGNHTSVNAQQADHASYIARMHRTIHANWGNGFLPRVSNNFPANHPLNDLSLETVVEIVIDADSGQVDETVRIEPSGNEMFDAEALTVARNVGDQPDPPDSIVSPDGNVYIHWTFWRDQRQCGTFGVRIYQLEEGAERRGIDDG